MTPRSSNLTLSLGTVITVSRKRATLLAESGLREGIIATTALDLCVGDRVRFSERGKEIFVEEILPRERYLTRFYRDTERAVAAHLDHLYIVNPANLIEPYFVDRVMAVCTTVSIPFTLIITKSDLADPGTHAMIKLYQGLGVAILLLSIKDRSNVELLTTSLANPDFHTVAFTGPSGAGKSSIVHHLLPDAQIRVGDVGERSGRGKQTTTQPRAYQFVRPGLLDLLLIDLPGIQNFGIGHLDWRQVESSFPEMARLRSRCRFQDCHHREELECGVKSALVDDHDLEHNAQEAMHILRYSSYLKMLDEIEDAKRY